MTGAGDGVPLPTASRTTDEQFDALVAVLMSWVRPTVDGDAYLAPNPAGRALAVLAACVAAIFAFATQDSGCLTGQGAT